MTAKAGVIGWPVEHSLSPLLHGHWLKEYGIDGSYEKIPASPEEFPAKIAVLRDAGFRGVNVTVPHKEAAFALANNYRSEARNAEAANLLVFTKDGQIGADNTDGTGLADSLMKSLGDVWLGGKNIVLIGAGGAARGAVFSLYSHHVGKITILNRNPERAQTLAAHAAEFSPDGHFHAGALEDWSKAASDADLVINTTSAGMNGNPPLDLDLGALNKSAAVCDIVYSPLETRLLQDAKARGHRTIDGLGMLMHQAVPSFQAFFYEEMKGRMPEVTPALRAVLVKALQARG